MDLKPFLFSFKGRINRKKYILASLISGVLINILVPVGGKLENSIFNIVLLLSVLLFLWISFALQAKRWHDLDKSGWWILINLVPILGMLYAFAMTVFVKGNTGQNGFGPDPLQ